MGRVARRRALLGLAQDGRDRSRRRRTRERRERPDPESHRPFPRTLCEHRSLRTRLSRPRVPPLFEKGLLTMKRLSVLPSVLVFAATLALPAVASGSDDALSLVPADAATVGVIRVSDLRTSPLASRLFSDTDHVCVGGDAQHFLDEARLNPKEDVDLVVAAGSPKGAGGSDGWGLVLFEGRFDPARLSAALVERGATKKTTPSGDYYVVPDRHADESAHGGGPAAIAFASKRLVIAGSEPAVVSALAQRGAGGTGFASGAGLGRQLSRIESGASAWALVDVSRIPAKDAAMRHAHVQAQGNGMDAATTLVSSMKSVQLLALQATAKGDALKLAATGVANDAETAGL